MPTVLSRLVARMSAVATALGLAAILTAGSAQVASAQACPSWNNPTVFGSHTLNAGFLPDPYVRNVTAGGRVDLANCRPYIGPGWFVTRPDFRLFYNGTSPTGQLTIMLRAASNVDTVLLVNAPDASWHHNDDYNNWIFSVASPSSGFDSAITFFNPLPGQYDIWTGSYTRSSNNPAQLIITEYTQ